MVNADFKDRLLECLGGAWPEPCPLNPKVENAEQADGFRREKISYEVEPGERIAAYLLIPDGVDSANKAPTICVWHQHAGQWHLGKSEPTGLAGNPMHHTGAALAREGYVVLCPDAWGFEDREKGYRLKGRNLERFLFLQQVVAGRCMAWKNILDMRRAVDYVVTRPEVDAERIGCYGHSMGSTHTWLIGPWETRLQALVGNCCLPTYKAIHDNHMLHCFPNFVPGILQFGDTPDIAALTAPRALHLNLGENDGGSPIEEAKKGCETIRGAYESMHAEDKFSYFIEPDTGHVLSDAMWKRTKTFFSTHLRRKTL